MYNEKHEKVNSENTVKNLVRYYRYQNGGNLIYVVKLVVVFIKFMHLLFFTYRIYHRYEIPSLSHLQVT